MGGAEQNQTTPDGRWQLVNRETGDVVVSDLSLATTWFRRFLGLQFRRHLPSGAGLLLSPCDSIHTCFCFFPMDVAFIAEGGEVISVRRHVRPWRMIMPVKGAKCVLETNADELELREHDHIRLIGGDARQIGSSLSSLTDDGTDQEDACENADASFQQGNATARWLTYVILLVSAGMLAFGSGFAGVFVYDDMPNIVLAPSMHGLSEALDAGLKDIPHGLRRRPIARLSFAANYELHGLDPWGYHLVNVSVHIAAALILFGIIRRALMLRGTPDWLQAHSMPIAFSTSLIWLVHPLQTESVTYIVQRLECMHGMFFLGALYALLRQATEPGARWGSSKPSGARCAC